MGEFRADWLALREPADRTARAATLTDACLARLRHAPLRLVDLAAGTGANTRYLAERLRGHQEWLLVDRDEALLGEIPVQMASWGRSIGLLPTPSSRGLLLRGPFECVVLTRCLDLSDLAMPEIFEGRPLVTAAALIDLVSAAWLEALANRCLEGGADALLALAYDGRIVCSPGEPEDEWVRTLVNRHQRTDKGFGDAAGPDAPDLARRAFQALGYEVRLEPSDWRLAEDARALQTALIEGWAVAAAEISPSDRAAIDGWHARRLRHVQAGRSVLIVGHQDVAAWHPSGRFDASGR